MHAIVFDWDGTLADSLGALFRANVEVLTALGVPFDAARYRETYAPDWRVFYRRLGVPADRLDEANTRWHDAYGRGPEVDLFPGVTEALRALRAAGHPLGLVTAGHRAIVESQIARAGVGDLIDAAAFGDDLVAPKPDPASLVRVLDRLGVADPARASYLGDVPDDMRMARRAGSRAVGIVSLVGTAEGLLAAGADEIATSVVAWAEAWLGRPVRAAEA